MLLFWHDVNVNRGFGRLSAGRGFPVDAHQVKTILQGWFGEMPALRDLAPGNWKAVFCVQRKINVMGSKKRRRQGRAID